MACSYSSPALCDSCAFILFVVFSCFVFFTVVCLFSRVKIKCVAFLLEEGDMYNQKRPVIS